MFMDIFEIFVSVVIGLFVEFVDLFRFHEDEEYNDDYRIDVDKYYR